MIDVYELFRGAAKNGIVGYDNFFVDGVHMTLEGYHLIGVGLAHLITKQGFITDDEVHSERARYSFHSKKQEMERSRSSYDTANVNSALGWAAFNQGNIKKALEKGKEAVQQDPQMITAHLLLGYVYAKLGMTENARKEWNVLRQMYGDRR